MSSQMIDLTGKQFGRLQVLAFAGRYAQPSGAVRYSWECRCECGNVSNIDGGRLRGGKSTQCRRCSLTRAGKSRCPHFKHGLSGTYWETIYHGMMDRCRNANNACYSSYGGRGVYVCERWRESMGNFRDDMGERPTPEHTIERIDNDGPYSPENCRWATRAEQNENTRQTRLLTLGDVTLSMGKWAKRLGINRETLGCRINRLGWSVEKALTTPVRPLRLTQPRRMR